MVFYLLLIMCMTPLVHASEEQHAAFDHLQRVHAHFDTHIARAENHHERAEVFNNAVKDVDNIASLDQNFKDDTIRHFVNTINRIEQEKLNLLVLSASKTAPSMRHIEAAQEEKHKFFAKVDDLINVHRDMRDQAKKAISAMFDDRIQELNHGVKPEVIHTPAEVKTHAHKHEASHYAEIDKLDRILSQFYTDIHSNVMRLSVENVKNRAEAVKRKIQDLNVSADAKAKAIKEVNDARDAKIAEHEANVPKRGAPAKKTRRLKGARNSEAEEKSNRYAPSRKSARPEGKESATQEAARLRAERKAAQ